VSDIGHAGLRVMLQIWRDASRCHDGRGHFNTEMCVGIRTLWIARRKFDRAELEASASTCLIAAIFDVLAFAAV